MPIGVGLRGLTFLMAEYAVALTSGVNTSGTVTFPEAFTNIPVVLVIPPLAGEGTWAVKSITTTGFTWNIDTTAGGGTSLGSINVGVGIVAHEKL